MDENKIKYGLKNVYYAKATFDEDGFPEYDTPVHIPGAVNLALDAEGEMKPWYADNMVYTVLNGNIGYSGDLEIAIIPESFATDILHEEVDTNGLMQEQTGVEIEHFALLFQFEGDLKAIRHVFYNCTCSRPAIESATTEDTKEPRTDTLQLEAMPLASGYVKGKTCSKTPEGIYNGFFDAVLLPGGEEKTYTVYFYNGSTLLQAVHDVPFGGSATYTGSTPTKEGYTFTGWDPLPENITKDTYCYAQFEIQTFTVRFYNGTTLLQTVNNVPYGGNAAYTGGTPVSPNNPDLRFLGWDPEPTNIKKDTDCYAQFEAQTYTVYFYNGDILLQTVTGIAYGGSATYTGTTPEKEGYTFTGWDPEPVNITGDTYCYAQFEIQTYTVYFYDGDTLLQAVTGVVYGGSAAYTGSTPEKEGYNFTGWDPEPVNIKGDTYCYAQFEIQTYTVYFYDGDTLLQTVTDVVYGGSAEYTGSTPEKEGYFFTGWDPEPVNITGDTYCYAQFEALIGFAIYSEDDSALIFYADAGAPDVGSLYDNRTVTNVYTGVESTTQVSIPWEDERENIESVSFDESFTIIRPVSTALWFYNFEKCQKIDLTNLDTSAVTSMASMFVHCAELTSLDLTPLDTSAVTNMESMFMYCYGLTSLDLTPLDTSSVRNMYQMFCSCVGLTSLDVSVLDTSSVTTMESMFSTCSGLTDLNISGLETSHVRSMYQMFASCSKLTSLDVTGFNTSAVTNMYNMFYHCERVTELDLTGFDTSAVTLMGDMFYRCYNLETIYADDSKFVTDNVTDEGKSMFDGCRNLVGGAGTKYSSSKVGVEMAHVDTEDNPGYFTEKN